MDLTDAQRLCTLTTDFYRRVGASFSATRQAPWKGWERLLGLGAIPEGEPLVLDLACGNLRFERFIARTHPLLQAWCVDSADAQAHEGMAALAAEAGTCHVRYQHLDVMDTLLAGRSLADALESPSCDLAVAFGFLHHVPLPEHRAKVLQALVAHTARGGHVAVSLWQFEHDKKIMAKARPVAGGDGHDYLLGWQDEQGVARYCHSFTDDEVSGLAASCGPGVREVARFRADGRTGDLNCYVVLEAL